MIHPFIIIKFSLFIKFKDEYVSTKNEPLMSKSLIKLAYKCLEARINHSMKIYKKKYEDTTVDGRLKLMTPEQKRRSLVNDIGGMFKEIGKPDIYSQEDTNDALFTILDWTDKNSGLNQFFKY